MHTTTPTKLRTKPIYWLNVSPKRYIETLLRKTDSTVEENRNVLKEIKLDRIKMSLAITTDWYKKLVVKIKA